MFQPTYSDRFFELCQVFISSKDLSESPDLKESI